MIYHYDALQAPESNVRQFDVMITDPPYAARVHANAVSSSARLGTRKRDLGFESLSRKLRQKTADFASWVKRWSVVFSDVEASNWLSLAVQARGVEYVRTMPWVRWSMPQLSGDRPPQGFEHILLYHPPGRKHWNGPGNLTHFANVCLRGEAKHKAEKPLDLCLDLVSFFSSPGETIFDPFAGHGTIGLACRLLDRCYVGLEIDDEWCQKANRRLHDRLTDRDLSRALNWAMGDREPTAAQTEGPSLERGASRKRDKERVQAKVR